MRDQINAAKVGALVVAAIVAAILLWRAVDESSAGGHGYRVFTRMNDASGLITKSRVTIAGIRVGTIDRISLEGEHARVDIVMDEGIALYADARVRKESASLLGENLLAINPGTPTERQLVDGDELLGATSTPGMGDIMEDVGAIASSVRAVSHQLETSFGSDEAGRQMASALRNLTEALEGVNRTIQANEEVVDRTLENVEGITDDARPRLEAILENVQAVTEQIRTIMQHNQGDIDRGLGETDDTIASIHRASEELEDVLADIGEVTERTAAGEGTVGRLTSDEHLIDEVETSVEGISDVVGAFTRLRTIVQLRSEYNFLSNTFKNYFSFELFPREGRYFLVQLVDDPRGRTEFSTTQVRRSPPAAGEPEFYEEQRVTTTEALLFSLQLAQRVYFATFRFGIMESSGGLGLDLHFFDERLAINADIFQFGHSQFPRLRTRLSYEIIDSLFILGGVDDFLNETTIDFFLGAMLQFDDGDLGNLFPFLGGAIGGAAR